MTNNLNTIFAAVCYSGGSSGQQRQCRRQFLYFIALVFVTRQLCIGCGLLMRDNNNQNMQGVWFIHGIQSYTAMSINFCSFTRKFLRLRRK